MWHICLAMAFLSFLVFSLISIFGLLFGGFLEGGMWGFGGERLVFKGNFLVLCLKAGLFQILIPQIFNNSK